jgi:uncharacterized protein (AIM24 family)
MNLIIDTLLKGTLSGIGSVFIGAIETVIKYTFTKKMAIKVIVDLMGFLAKSTKTNIDNEIVDRLKQDLISVGELPA